jgi:hypothetical protein
MVSRQRMTLWLQIENEDPDTIEVAGPGGEIRVGVGSAEGPRSSVWRVWANPNSDDVYLANRDTAAFEKISLHSSGKWRLAFTREASSLIVPTGQDRSIDKWRRPDEIAVGLTLACQIWIPGTEVASIGVPRGKRKSLASIIWLPKPSVGEAIGLHIALWRPNQGVARLTGSAPVGAFFVNNRDGGMEACLVFASRMTMTSDHEARVAEDKRRVMEAAQARGVDTSLPGLRAHTFGLDGNGHRVHWDLCLNP